MSDISETPTLPICPPEIIQQLNCTVLGTEDPSTGRVHMALDLWLPPLVPGGLAYIQSLAPFFRILGPAIAKGLVVLVDEAYAAAALEGMNALGVVPSAGWLSGHVHAQLLLLSKILNGTLTAEELAELRAAIGDAGVAHINHLRAQLHLETPAQHIRNAIALLRAHAVNHAIGTPLDADSVHAIERRLCLALEQLHAGERYTDLTSATWTITPIDAAALEAHDEPPGRAIDEPRCVYCDCTEYSACGIPVSELADDVHTMVEMDYLAQGLPLPATVPCWWISENPWVCSRPTCVAAFRGAGALIV